MLCACQESPSYTCTLTTLDLRGNDIGAGGAGALASTLTATGNRTLTSLNLNGNAIGDEGGLALAALLAVRSPVVCTRVLPFPPS